MIAKWRFGSRRDSGSGRVVGRDSGTGWAKEEFMNAVRTEELKSIESASAATVSVDAAQRVAYETLKLEKRLCREVGKIGRAHV